jgi:predicted transcriptional regulator
MFSEKISNFVFANLCALGEIQRDSGFWGVPEVSVKLKQKKKRKNFGERERKREGKRPWI